MISTNSSADAAALVNLPALFDFSGLSATDWQQETLDLTPYVGQSIQVVWYYIGVAIGTTVQGWLVNDVAITGLAFGQGGTLMVAKNLAQGTYNITGPANYSGSYILTTITNAPPGQYTVDFTDVAFYQTPPPQTNTLASGDTITFAGNYSFIDVNQNGISDAWEKYYFGVVSTNRTQHTDTDGNGMSDYAKFVARINPTNPASKFIILSAALATNQLLRLEWSTIPPRIYQVQASTDLKTWTPVSDWLQASVSPMSYTVTNSASRSQSYRIQVQP